MASTDSVVTTLLAGTQILDRVLGPPGFNFVLTGSGVGSGGPFACGDYVRGDRRLELHFRDSLGLVMYHAGNVHIAHTPYLRALGVPRGAAQYPGFSDDPIAGFHHLAHDLTSFCDEFLNGDVVVLRRTAPIEMTRSEALFRADRARYEGDDRKREEARANFHAGNYAHVVELLEDIHYPELLPHSERQMLEVARRRVRGDDSRELLR